MVQIQFAVVRVRKPYWTLALDNLGSGKQHCRGLMLPEQTKGDACPSVLSSPGQVCLFAMLQAPELGTLHKGSCMTIQVSTFCLLFRGSDG